MTDEQRDPAPEPDAQPEPQTEAQTEPEQDEERPVLDPEAREKRRRALALIRTFGDPSLRSKALEVTRFDEALAEELRRMGQLMDDAVGLGLAATQVGVMHRVLVYRVGLEAPLVAVVNPALEWSSVEQEVAEEGCLSLPGVAVDVERPLHARIRALDGHGDPILIEASGLEARVLQHEMDHLNGVLIIDRIPKEQRREALKILREGGEMLEPRSLRRDGERDRSDQVAAG
jgi:peptide deformylase